MPIRITKKSRQGNAMVVEGTAQLLDETACLDKPVVLQECQWKASIERGQTLWNIDVLTGDDLRGYIQSELQRRTKRSS
jgi:hypothetical protein